MPERRVVYPSGGPPDLVFPPGDDAYGMLAGGDCKGLRGKVAQWPVADDANGGIGVDPQVRLLYRSAAAACLLQWDIAASDLGLLDQAKATFEGNCDQRDVLAWVRALVEAHRSDPTFAPVFTKGAASTTCTPTTDSDAASSSTAPDSSASTSGDPSTTSAP